MSNDHEQAYALDAQEEVTVSQNQISQTSSGRRGHAQMEEANIEEPILETDPLLGSGGNAHKRRDYKRAGASYHKAINEPWTGAHGKGDTPWYRKPSIFWLLPAFFPFCIAFGGIIVPKTYLIVDLICRDVLSDRAAKDPTFQYLPVLFGEENRQCQIPQVQRVVGYFNASSDFLTGIFSAIVAPFFGALSDRIGRKKVIVIASMGALLGEVITIIAGNYPDKVSVWWLLLGSAVDGLCGSFTTALALAFAYASDSSSPDKRAVAFGYFHATLFTGLAIGPIFAGALIKYSGNILIPFYVALGCHFCFMFTTAVIVPESLSQERQEIAREKWANEWAELSGPTWMRAMKKFHILVIEPLWILRPQGKGSSPELRRNLLVLAAIDTMMFGVAMGAMRVLLNYALYRFGWQPVDSSVFLSTVNVVRVTGLVVFLPLLTRIFRNRSQASSGNRGSDRLDLNIIKVCVMFDLVGYLGYALAPTGAFMFPAGIIAALGGVGSPTLASSLTKHVPARMTGQMLGVSALLHALARVVAPVIFNLIWAGTVEIYPGFVFLCLSSVFVVVFVISWFLKPNVYLDDDTTAPQESRHTTGETES